MAKKGVNRTLIRLVCKGCNRSNYVSTINFQNMRDSKGEDLVLNKYCPKDRKHKPHKINKKLK